jgi:micrococcal nuclease
MFKRLLLVSVAMISIIAFFYLTAFYLKSGCKGHGKCFEGQITEVIDGDTIFINNIKVRLALIDAPEIDQPYGNDARNFILKICPLGSKVNVDEDDQQRSGSFDRIVAKVYCNGKNLNSELLHAKLAVIDLRFCNKSEFADEEWAKICRH